MECHGSGNPKTGAASVNCGVMKGNASAGVFATTNSSAGPVTKGISGAVNAKGHGLSVEHQHTEHRGSSTTVAGQANLFKNNQAELKATAFHTHNGTHDQSGGGLNMKTKAGHGLSVEHGHTKHFGSSTSVAGQANLFKNKQAELNATAFHTHNRNHEQFGGGLNMQTTAGHSAALGVSHTPKFNMTSMNASGTANLYSSPSGNFNLDATANATRHMSGPFRGKSDINTGLNMNYKF